jgi:signal transduction histidine kinase
MGTLASLRGTRNPLALPLALLSMAFFAYDTLEVIRQLADDPEWDWLDRAAAALVGPPTLWLVAAFVGESRRLRAPLVLATVYFVGLSVVCALAVFVPALRWLPGSDAWALAMLAGMAPTFPFIPILIVRHAWAADAEERARTQIFGLAMLLGIGGVTSELVAISGGTAPRVAAVGIVVCVLLLGILVLRARLLDDTRGLVVVAAVALGSVAIVGHVLLFEAFGDDAALFVLGATLLTLSLVGALRPIQIHLTEQRDRTRHLATLGRFSVQMAHDLKNPLAAIRGAAQWLAEDSKSAAHSEEHRQFVALVLEQADRLGAVVGEYERLGRVSPVLAPVDVGAIAEEVAGAQRAAARTETTTIRARIDGSARRAVMVDRALLQGAIENLVKNARDALGADRAGRIEIVVEMKDGQLAVRVEDDGPGMDARTRERAFDEFFTTKASGSGLGLALVARVARAHGGRVKLDSDPGRGTSVEMTLPLATR